MKRLIKFERGTVDDLNVKKYVLVQEYEGFGVYEEVCPAGWHVHQSWLIANDNVALVCLSFTEFCKEELLDMIDCYKEKKCFGINGFHKTFYDNLSVYIAHQGYKNLI